MLLFVIFAIFWPALSGVALWFLPRAKEDRKLRSGLVCGALALEIVAVIALCFAQGYEVTLLKLTPTLHIFLRIDAIGCIFAVLMSVMWLLAAVFALDYLGHDAHERSFQAFYMTVLSALIGQCYAGSMITLYVFYELMTMLSVPLVVHERTPQAVAAGIKYLIYSIFGAMMGLLGIFFFNHYLGSVTFAPGGIAAASGAPVGPVLAVAFMVILGFGTKAGMFPMHG